MWIFKKSAYFVKKRQSSDFMVIVSYLCSSITDLLPVCNFEILQFPISILTKQFHLQIGNIVRSNFHKFK